MAWTVEFHVDFVTDYRAMDEATQDALFQKVEVLKELGPRLGRPGVDTLKGSKFKNMKELRFEASGGVWRVAFAFDPQRKAILLTAGDKSGVSQNKFYDRLIATADARFEDHLADLKKGQRS